MVMTKSERLNLIENTHKSMNLEHGLFTYTEDDLKDELSMLTEQEKESDWLSEFFVDSVFNS